MKSVGKPLQHSIVEFVRSQECGFDEGYPMVCCSMLANGVRFLKHSKSVAGVPINKLSADLPQSVNSYKDRSRTRNIGNVGNVLQLDENLRNKADALNKAFMSEYFDYGGAFDLMIRIKRYQDNELNVEIR